MKKAVLLIVLAGVLGCSFGRGHMAGMLGSPPGILEDSLYVKTQAQLDELEKRYLNQEISYAVYLQKKQALEDHYKQVADQRSKIIEGNE